MAINKTVNKSTKSHGAMRNVLEYVLRDSKTKEHLVTVTGPYDRSVIDYDNAYQTFLEEKRLWNKDSGRMYAHNVISFHKDEEITLNLDVANGYINALRGANESLGLTDDITLSQVSRFPDVFIVKKIIEDEESVWNNIRPVAEEAVAKFVSMRETEGAKMKDDLLSRLDFILKEVEKVEIQSPKTTENYRNRLYQKLKEVLSDNNIDEQRIVTEAAIFSEKIAVDEETVRLRSHISQFKELLETSEPVGRKLDFLVQEMNREANTIGSKAQDVAITKIVVDIKSEIEKIREQIQNIE